MRVVSFSITHAHGYLSLDVRFKHDLTFLTGINGSGKTTVVRGVVALLQPSFRSLAGIEFRSMRATVEHAGSEATIFAERHDDLLLLGSSECPDAITIPTIKPTVYEPSSRFATREQEFYQEQYASFSRSPVIEFLSSLPTPMFLDLERSAFAPVRRNRIGALRTREVTRVGPFMANPTESLAFAQDLVEDAYRGFMVQQQELTDRLRRELILATFPSVSDGHETSKFELPTQRSLSKLSNDERLVVSTLATLGISETDIEERVKPYFRAMRELTTALAGKKLERLIRSDDEDGINRLGQWMSLQPIASRISDMVRLVERFTSELDRAHEPIRNYVNSVNRFLGDSGKRLEFTNRGVLSVVREEQRLGGVTALSSGERQLVVILSHLAFHPQAQSANVLIIDEPELSLHVHWQEMFVDVVQMAAPQIQLIFATHSPSIIMDRVRHCVDMVEARR